ncbi:MAG: selenoneine biosynthesis selenosugar synthase SenB [Pseudomonadota bacterium]
MDIQILTPAPPGSRAGNRATAERWSRLLEQAGHRVSVLTDLPSETGDLFIALHAWRSHEAIVAFRRAHPRVPLITVLTGTDIYFHQHEYPEETRRSMELADTLIGLHDGVASDIPAVFRSRLVTVRQSAEALPEGTRKAGEAQRSDECFDICVIGHLREEKDSLRAALASHRLSPASRIRVINAGRAHNPEWQARAEREQAANPRFRWVGELGKTETRALMARSRLMVISSVMEGGANVVSEACRAGLPILASDISGNRGLLGDDYPGSFRVGDDEHLAELLRRAETSPAFLAELRAKVVEKAALFVPEAEQAALLSAMAGAIAHSKARLNPEA